MAPSVSSGRTVSEAPRIATSGESDMKDMEPQRASVQFPEGGTAAWCTVIGAALVQFCGFGYTSSFGAYQDYYTLHYLTNESSSAISWIGSINAFLVPTVGLLSGFLYDRGYFYHLLIGGSLMESITLFMLSLAQPSQYYQILLAQGIGLGVAQGLLYVPTLAVVSHYFDKRRTLAMCLVTAGSSLGAVVHPIMLNYLFNRDIGFANGVRISAAFVSVLLLTACLIIRTRLEPPQRPTDYLSVARGIINDPPFCVMGAGLTCFHMGFYFPLFYLQLDSVSHGNPETFSFYSLVLLNGGALIGRLSTGFIAPCCGTPRLIIVSTAISSFLIFGMIGLSNVPSVILTGTLFGYCSGIYIALLAPLISHLTDDFSELGARIGFGVSFTGIGSLLGGPIAGALLTSQYEWWRSALFGGCVTLAGSSLLVIMQFMLTRRKRGSLDQNTVGAKA